MIKTLLFDYIPFFQDLGFKETWHIGSSVAQLKRFHFIKWCINLVKLTTASVILDLQIAENYSSECQTWIIGALLPTSQQYWLCGAVVKSFDCSRLCILYNNT